MPDLLSVSPKALSIFSRTVWSPGGLFKIIIVGFLFLRGRLQKQIEWWFAGGCPNTKQARSDGDAGTGTPGPPLRHERHF